MACFGFVRDDEASLFQSDNLLIEIEGRFIVFLFSLIPMIRPKRADRGKRGEYVNANIRTNTRLSTQYTQVFKVIIVDCSGFTLVKNAHTSNSGITALC
jgi:hypothetical protein